MRQIYLDHNANSPLTPSMVNFLKQEIENLQIVSNPSSTHHFGRKSLQKIRNVRETIARFFNVQSQEVIFTSGGTEGASWLLSNFLQNKPKAHVVSSNLEHACVYQTLKTWEKAGREVTFLSGGTWGCIQASQINSVLQPHTGLISLLAVNNETGVYTDVASIAKLAQQASIPLLIDGVAWLGKEKISIPQGVTALFFSGHKIGALTGIGFCICRKPFSFSPLFLGGMQEYQKRAGTENLLGIFSLGQIITDLETKQDQLIAHMRYLRERFEKQLINNIENIQINGEGFRVSNTANITFTGISGESLLLYLDRKGVFASHGSACSSGGLEPSRILLNMGLSMQQARSSLRFSFGFSNSVEEIDEAVQIIIQGVSALRALH